MSQYVFTMHKCGKIVPPKKEILRDISLSFFPGAKIGVLGYNGAGKSTLLKIMAGLDKEFVGEARPQPGLKMGYLPQEPQLDPNKTVRGNVEEALGDIFKLKADLDAVYAAYAEEGADFDKLAARQADLEAQIAAADGDNLNVIKRLFDVIQDPGFQSGPHVFPLCLGRDHNNGDGRSHTVLLQLT